MKEEHQIMLVLILAFSLMFAWFGYLINGSFKEIETQEIITVEVIDKVVKNSGSTYGRSYTECVFEFEGKRYTTTERPCLYKIGEKFNIGIYTQPPYKEGTPDIFSVSRLN